MYDLLVVLFICLFFLTLKKIYLFLGVLGLRFCARAFSSCGEWGPLFNAVRGPLTVAASLVAEYRLQTRRLSSSGSRAQLLRGMWDLPRPVNEPVSPALAGRFSTTAPPGKPCLFFNNTNSLQSLNTTCKVIQVCGLCLQIIDLTQWFSTGDDCAFQKTLSNVWRRFGCHNLEGGRCNWHLLGRGWGYCCNTSVLQYKGQSPQQELSGPKCH